MKRKRKIADDKCQNLNLLLREKAEPIVRHYKEDLDKDIENMTSLFRSDKTCYYYIMFRDCGSYAFPVKDVFVEGTFANTAWKHYAEIYVDQQSAKNITAFLVYVDKVWGGNLFGKVKAFDYKTSVEDVKKNAVDFVPEVDAAADESAYNEESYKFNSLLKARTSNILK